jgi:hypothetical protein
VAVTDIDSSEQQEVDEVEEDDDFLDDIELVD